MPMQLGVTIFALPVSAFLVVACGGRTAEEGGDSSAQQGSTGSTDSTGDLMDDCEPILQVDGTSTGYVHCTSADVIVRVEPAICSDPLPSSNNLECGAGYGTCSSNADCTDAPYGACGLPNDVMAACHCEYGCMSDADCSSNQVCMCAPVGVGTGCIEADCRSDADCDPGYHCALSMEASWSNWGLPSLHCHGPSDLCQGDADCPDGECRWYITRWECNG